MSDHSDPGGYVAFPKRVAIGVVVAALAGLSVQGGGFIWYASKLDSRVVALEQADRRILDRGDERFKGLQIRLEVLERDRDRLTRVEEKVGFIWEAVREMSTKLDRRELPRRP